MIEVTIQCDDCQAVCKIQHDLIESRYEVIEQCPFCGSDDVFVDINDDVKTL
jgi:Zn finger protein HypA/HybF involved in hydrogenase expression